MKILDNLFKKSDDNEAIIAALNRSQAVIEFSVDGTILSANENFLKTVGYDEDEIIGEHHRLFVKEEDQQHADYGIFWSQLASGTFKQAEFRRVAKAGNTIWLQATYNPIKNSQGEVIKVIKFATDITDQKSKDTDFQCQLDAIDKAQAVIEFELDGTIRHANNNFLSVMGYEQEEIKGKHHSIFVNDSDKNDPSYAAFWKKLRHGEYQAAQYQRIGKGGKTVWIEASYNPIYDAEGKVSKVIKFATDITDNVKQQAYFNTL